MNYQQFRPRSYNVLPEVVKNLLIINGIMFLATFLLQKRGIDLNDYLGLHYFKGSKFRLYQVFTYMFMHGSFVHILFNMIPLWMLGASVENYWGPKRFLTYYLITGLGAGITHTAVTSYDLRPAMYETNRYIENPSQKNLQELINSNELRRYDSPDLDELAEHKRIFIDEYNTLYATDPHAADKLSVDYVKELQQDIYNAPVVVGASGAVFGILLAFGMLFPNTLLYVYLAFPIKAKYFVIIYGVAELFYGISPTANDNVAHFAHLGGLLTGILLILYWRRKHRSNF